MVVLINIMKVCFAGQRFKLDVACCKRLERSIIVDILYMQLHPLDY